MGLGAAAIIGAVGGIVSTGVSVAGAVKSFQDADEQADIARKAERDAKKAMARAKDRIEMDEYAGLTMPMDAYRAQRDLLSQSQQQSVEALKEQDRPGAGIGAVGMAALMTSGFENINQAIQTGAKELPLYIKSGQDRRTLDLQDKYKGVEGFDKLTPTEQRTYLDTLDRKKAKGLLSRDVGPGDVIWKDGQLIYNIGQGPAESISSLIQNPTVEAADEVIITDPTAGVDYDYFSSLQQY